MVAVGSSSPAFSSRLWLLITNAPVNALGYLRVMFAVDDIDETLARLRKLGAQLVSSEVVQYEDAYRLCYIRGPDGLLIGLAARARLSARRAQIDPDAHSGVAAAGCFGPGGHSSGNSRCWPRTSPAIGGSAPERMRARRARPAFAACDGRSRFLRVDWQRSSQKLASSPVGGGSRPLAPSDRGS